MQWVLYLDFFGGVLQQYCVGELVVVESDWCGVGYEMDIYVGFFCWNGGVGLGLGGLQVVVGGCGEYCVIGLGGVYFNFVVVYCQVGWQCIVLEVW